MQNAAQLCIWRREIRPRRIFALRPGKKHATLAKKKTQGLIARFLNV
jgi:hypothetical protein